MDNAIPFIIHTQRLLQMTYCKDFKGLKKHTIKQHTKLKEMYFKVLIRSSYLKILCTTDQQQKVTYVTLFT